MIQQSQTIVRETGTSYRHLCHGLALPYSTFNRWRARVRCGSAPCQTPGPKKLGNLPLEELQEQIAALKHQNHRTAGTTLLYQDYREKISRRDLNQMVSRERKRRRKARRFYGQQLTWIEPNTAWALDATEYEADANGQKLLLVGWQDLATSFQFEALAGLELSGQQVAQELEKLFGDHGTPLFLKRDNGSIFNNQWVDEVLARHAIIPLNSPPACPRYNGAMEKGLQQLKGSLARILPAPEQWDVPKAQPFIRTALDRQNLTQRPRLQGRCAWSAYQQMERTRWPRRLRHEIFEWIKRHAECRMNEMEKNDQQSFASAWRWAALTWLRCQGLVVVSENKCVTPFFDLNGS